MCACVNGVKQNLVIEGKENLWENLEPMSVAIIGTVALDSIETPQGAFSRILGGSASYAGVAASIFSPVSLCSIIGKDFPQEHLDYFNTRTIQTEGITKSSGDTFHWKGFYKADMAQAYTLATDLNVLLDFNPLIPESMQNAAVVFMANIDPELQTQAIKQFKNPKLIVLDSMNFWIETKKEALLDTLKRVDVVILNDQEIKQLTQTDSILQAMPKLLALGPKRVIVKKGEHGAIMFNGTSHFVCPAVPLTDLVDPTGAGDSFAGGICGYLAQASELNEENFRKAMIAGTLISSNTVRDFSLNQLKKLTRESLQTQFEKFKELAAFPEFL